MSEFSGPSMAPNEPAHWRHWLHCAAVAVRSNLPIEILAMGLFCALAFLLRTQQSQIASMAGIGAQVDATGQLRPLADVIEITRALKLVTVVVPARVKAEMRNEQWRGNVAATVEAPVRYVYGVDLSQLDPSAFHWGRILGVYEVTIPEPTRIAVEVDGSQPIQEVEVTGSRFRAVSGEYYLGLAQKKLYEQARTDALPPETMAEIRTKTREQVEDLVQRFVGSAAQVQVRFDKP